VENTKHPFWARFWKSEEGNVLPIMAVATLVLAALIGGGVDLSRAYMTQNRLQNACDAAVLAGRRSVTTNGLDTAAKKVAGEYFNVNFANVGDVSSTSFVPSTPDNGNTIVGTASTDLKMTLMNIFGFSSMLIRSNCTASMSMGNADVMMVLDTTGSMGWDISSSDSTDRIVALRAAMKNFYSSLAATVSATNARVRYGFVPYSHTVNVGYLLTAENSSWIADTTRIQSREAQYIDVQRNTDEVESYKAPVVTTSDSVGNYQAGGWSDHSGSWRYSSSCNDSKPSNTSWVRYGSTSTSTSTYIDADDNRITETRTTYPYSRTAYECYYKSSDGRYWVRKRTETIDYYWIEKSTEEPIYKTETVKSFDRYIYKAVDYDTSQYKLGATVSTKTGSNGASQNSTWAGCIEERNTVASGSISYSSITGFSPSNLYDLDIDSAPTNDATRWKPYWPEVTYIRTDSSNRYVTSASQSDYGSYVGSSCPRPAQLLKTMTKSQFDAYADALSPNGSTYHDIGMIWGARMISTTGLFASNVNATPPNGGKVGRHIIFMTDGQMDTTYSGKTARGVEWHDRRVTLDGYTDQDKRHNDRLLAMCAAIKARGTRLWVIAFSTSLTSTLSTCASPDSSFTADSASSLNTAFQEIARDVGELRIVQ